MNSRTHPAARLRSDQTSHREDASPSALPTARMTTSGYCWSWRSLHRRINAGIVWVSTPGDYALFNSNHIPDGTVMEMGCGLLSGPIFVIRWLDVLLRYNRS